MNPVARLRASSRTPLLQVVKTAVAVIGSVVVCQVVLPNGPFPTFAAIAALLVIQPSINQSFVRGLERSAGVLLGVFLATALHFWLGDAAWIVVLTIVLAILIAWALRLTPTSATQVGISGMLVLTQGVVTPHYSLDRIVETLIGAAIALAVNALVVPPVLLEPAHMAVSRLVRDTAVAFERLAIGLTRGWNSRQWHEALETARMLRPAQAKSDASLAAARESLRMNPRRSRHSTVLERDIEISTHLSVLVTRAIGMTRAIHDNYSPDLLDDPVIGNIATELARIGADIRSILGPQSTSDDASSKNTPPAPSLTAPISVVSPNEDHWILIGSLLEDIRRVREELLGGGA